MHSAHLNIKAVFGVLILLLMGQWQFLAMAADKSLNQRFLEAAREGHSEQVRSLLSKGAHVKARDNRGMTALSWARLNIRSILPISSGPNVEEAQDSST